MDLRMRALFSSTQGARHLQPLFPYAHALEAHGHQDLIAGPAEIADTLRAAGLNHAPEVAAHQTAIYPLLSTPEPRLRGLWIGAT
jgi:hypothetical protein